MSNADDRAIVTLTSRRYWPGTYVLAKMLRHYGCEVPLHVYTTEIDDLPNEMRSLRRTIFYPSDHDLASAGKKRALVMAGRPERYQFYLGSDTYPVKNLDVCFDDVVGHDCLLWEDIPDGDRFIPEHYGFPPEVKLSTFQPQGDTMLFDMNICREALLWAAHNIDNNAPGGSCGDQTTYRAAWYKFGLEQYRYGTGPVDWTSVEQVFLHKDAGGQTLIVHRVGSKWPLTFGSPLTFNRNIPEEPEAWHYYRQINEAMR